MVLAVGKPCALAEGSSNSLCSFAVNSDGFVILQNNAPIKTVHIGISYLVGILIKPIADSFYLKCALSVIHLPPTFFFRKRNKNSLHGRQNPISERWNSEEQLQIKTRQLQQNLPIQMVRLHFRLNRQAAAHLPAVAVVAAATPAADIIQL